MTRVVFGWLLHWALSPRWVLGLLAVAVFMLTQLVYWRLVWQPSERPAAVIHLDGEAAQPLNHPLDLKRQHLEDWPSADESEAFWSSLQSLAQEFGLIAKFSNQGAWADWVLQGAFADWMAWLFELSKNHPWLVVESAVIQPTQSRTDEQLNIRFELIPRNHELDLSWTLAAAKKPIELSKAGREYENSLYALERKGDWDSPFGLARWNQAFISSPWALKLTEQRPTSLTQQALTDMRWVGTLRSASNAKALVQVGDKVWTVQKGDRVGLGANRVRAIHADHLLIEVLTLKSSGELGVDVVVIGAEQHE